MTKKILPILFLLMGIGIVHIFINTQIAYVGYNINSAKKEFSSLRDKNRDLAAKVAKKESLWRIDSVAKNKLNMHAPEKINYIIVSEEANAKK